jgi:protocatechuate 3,4-dioxygenase beta subunit
MVSAEGYASFSKNAMPPADDFAVTLRTAGTLRGRVEDADAKRPVPGFSVTSGTSQVGGGQSYFMRDWSASGSAAQGDDGSFEIPNVTPGKITVRATAPGYRPGEVAVEIAEGETKEGVLVSLRRGGSVAGRVLDGGRGTPVANASVSWRPSGATTMMGDFSSNNTNTDADGKFRFDGLPPGTLTVTARHADYAEATKDVDPDKESAVDVSLAAGGFISGVLVGRDGRSPVAGAVVTINGQRAQGNDTARTDDAGGFSFDHLRPGRFRLTARAPQGQPPPKDLVLTENERQEGVLLAIRGAGTRIRGTVTGLPREKLGTIRISGNAKDWGDSTLTDDSGAFTFTDVPAGMVRFFAMGQNGMSRSTSKTVEVPEGASELPVEVSFDGNSRLTGRVTRADRPVTSAWIFAAPDPPVPNASRSQGQTDENGRYTLDGLADGPHIVYVSGQGFSYQKTVTVSGETVADVAVPASAIAGTVTDEASGDPIEGVHVQAETGRESNSFSMKSAVTDASGRYEISGVDAGTYQVTARKSGYQMRTRSAAVGSDATDASFALAKGAGVVVRVTDGTTGLPLKNVAALAFASTGLVAFQGEVALDGSGKGEIPSLSPGRYSVYLFAGGFAPRSLPSLQAPSAEVSVSMTPGGRVEVRCDGPVSGRLTDASGSVYLTGIGRIDGRVFAAPPLVVWENVAPGTYTFSVTGATGAKSYALTVAEGQTSRLDLK